MPRADGNPNGPEPKEHLATYPLTWNRALWPWDELREEMRTIEQQGCRSPGNCPHVWGYGVTRRIVPGDRVFSTIEPFVPLVSLW